MAQTSEKRFAHGVIVGKFYPLHRGHQYLIEAALAQCQTLTISISHRDESIPAAIRIAWIRTLYPSARVRLAPPGTPYHPNECASEAAFYTIWRALLLDACGTRPDAVFSSEDYGHDLAAALGCAHVCVDRERVRVPISGTRIRKDPYAHWHLLDPVVRAYFVKTVCVYGPESCGKTTLARQLAERFDTVWQPEFARDYLGERHCELADMVPIAEGHLADRERFKRLANKLLFIDTDTYTTGIFSRHYYGQIPPRVSEIAALTENQNDTYLLLTPDVPWVADTSRDLSDPRLRWKLFDEYRLALESRGKRYEVIAGPDFNERFERAVRIVEQWRATWRID